MLSVDPTTPHAPTVAAADWVMVQLPRLDGPPLRFKGRERFAWSRGDLDMRLWERKRGGVVVSYPVWDDAALRPHAVVCKTLDAVATHLESRCVRPWVAPDGVSLPGLPLTGLLRRMQNDHDFPLLVGDVLAALDPHLSPAEQSHQKGH